MDTAANTARFLSGLQLAPNPMADESVISYLLPYNDGTGNIQITDLVGNLVESYHAESAAGEIQLNNPLIAPGIYFCTLRQDSKIMDVKKFIKL